MLTNGELRCPHCTNGQLTPWGHGRQRTVRDLAGTTAVIGTALLHKAKGLGYRRIATAINRPVSTVRRWLRRLPPTHLERHLPRRDTTAAGAGP